MPAPASCKEASSRIQSSVRPAPERGTHGKNKRPRPEPGSTTIARPDLQEVANSLRRSRSRLATCHSSTPGVLTPNVSACPLPAEAALSVGEIAGSVVCGFEGIAYRIGGIFHRLSGFLNRISCFFQSTISERLHLRAGDLDRIEDIECAAPKACRPSSPFLPQS